MFNHKQAFQNMDYPQMGHSLATTAQKSLTKHVPFIKDSKNLEDDVHYIIYSHTRKFLCKYIIEDTY